ncbi:MAG: hypothetical protein IJT06_00290 [Selenomonadaceae bacterium]|nr:hypothetical protein [Selenomonadaceae bacterium]
MLVISIVLAVFIGYLFRATLIDSMSNVKVAQEAQEYLNKDSVDLTTEIDTYLYTNITVIPKDKDEDEDQKQIEDDNNDDSDDDADDDSDNDSDNDSDSGSDGGNGDN